MESTLKTKLLNTHKKVNILFTKKKYRKCFKILNKIIPLIDSDEELFFTFIKQQGLTLYNLHKYQEAIFYLEIALNKAKDDKSKYEIHKILFNSYIQISDYQKIIDYGLKVSEYKDISLSEKAKILSIVSRFYYLLYLQSNLKVYLIRGLFYNTECQKIFNQLNDNCSQDYMYTLYDCADINFGLEDYDTAINYYEKVENMTNDPDILYGIYANLSYIYKEKGYLETMMFYKSKINALN